MAISSYNLTRGHRGQSIPVLAFILFLALHAPVVARALTEAEIEEAIQFGHAAKPRNVASFLFVGFGQLDEPAGRAIMLGPGERYAFLVRSCRQWISYEAFRSKAMKRELDRQALTDRCLGRNLLEVVVAHGRAEDEFRSLSTETFSAPKWPVVGIHIRLDGARLDPISLDNFDGYGVGNGTALFDVEQLRDARRIRLVAEVADHDEPVELGLKRWIRRRVFQ